MFVRSLKLSSASLTILLLLLLLPHALPPMLSEAQTEPTTDLTGEWRGEFTLWSQALTDSRVEQCYTSGTIVITIFTQSGDQIMGAINAEIDFTECPLEAEQWLGNYLSGPVQGRVSGTGMVKQVDMVVGFSGLPLSGVYNVGTDSMELGYQGDLGTLEITLTPVSPPEEAFDFSILVTPSENTVIKGGSASYLVTVTLVQGRAEPVILLAPKSDEQLGFISDPPSGTPPFTSTLTVSTSNATKLGEWWFTIGAEGGGVHHETDKIYLIVEEAVEEPFDFSISVSPTENNVTKGGSASYTVTVSLVSGKGVPVTLLAPEGNGLKYAFNPDSGTAPFTSMLTVFTSDATEPGRWRFKIGGEGEGITHVTDEIYLSVASPISPEMIEEIREGVKEAASHQDARDLIGWWLLADKYNLEDLKKEIGEAWSKMDKTGISKVLSFEEFVDRFVRGDQVKSDYGRLVALNTPEYFRDEAKEIYDEALEELEDPYLAVWWLSLKLNEKLNYKTANIIKVDGKEVDANAGEHDHSDTSTIVDKRIGDCTDYANLLVDLLRNMNIPTRMIRIFGKNPITGKGYGHALVEVYVNGNWMPIDPTWAKNVESADYLVKNLSEFGGRFYNVMAGPVEKATYVDPDGTEYNLIEYTTRILVTRPES